MATKRTSECYSTMIQQKATTAFDGTLPAGDAPLTRGIYKYAEAAAGGLLRWESNEPVVVNQIFVTLSVSGNITLSLVNLDDNDAPISGEEFKLEVITGVTYLRLTEYEVVLLPKQALKLVTTQPGIVQIGGSHERTFYH
jgi:hypothetical protein